MFRGTLISWFVLSLGLVCIGCVKSGSTVESRSTIDLNSLTNNERRFVEACGGKRSCMEVRLYQLRFATQYRATKQPVFRLQFRHQYPTMSEEEIEFLVNEAVEDGLKEALEQEQQRLIGEFARRPQYMRPPVSCMSSQVGSYSYTDCY